MKELEDTHSEVKKIVDLQYSSWDLSSSFDDNENPVDGSLRSNGSFNVLGGFLDDTNYAWLSCGTKLSVFNCKTGANVSSWTFKERITCVAPFLQQSGQLPLLLVGTDNDATRIRESTGMVCVFDCTISKILRAIKMPAGVEQLCVINGGTEWEEINEKKINILLIENYSGIACVTLRNLNHLMIDLRRNSWDQTNFPCADELNPAELDIANNGNTSRHRANREKHSVYNLMNERIENYIGFNRDDFESTVLSRELLTTVIICSRKIGCLISGCLGRVIIWQNDGIVRWISPATDDNLIISHLALLEPTDDPRPFCYLWVAYQEDVLHYPPILKMYAMLFEKKYADKGTNFYFNLEGEPSLKFEFELEEKNRIISLYPIIRESSPEQTESGNKRGEDSLLLINIDGKSILFDLNQWYKEQMPRFSGECQNIQAIVSSYLTKSDISESENVIVNCSYVPSTLNEFFCSNPSPPEEFFFPNSLALEWIQLGTKKLITWMTRGIQTQLLRDIAMTGPSVIIQPTESYHRCIAAGLISFNSDLPYNNDIDSQRDAILTLCLEQRWTTFLLKCAREWSDGSVAYLYPAFLRWSMQRASAIKLNTHELCIPLFDESGSSIGESEMKTLRFYSQQMDCLCNVVDNLPTETTDLEQQRRTLRRISMYLEILLWFYDVGLLPETQDVDEEPLPISFILRIPYPVDKLVAQYEEKREQCRKHVVVKKDDNEKDLFIDELITRECPTLRSQWEQESNRNHYGGHYPPPSLQSLLRSCLTDCYQPDASNEMENKHQIIIYLLMDLVMLLQGVYPNVDQLIKYPSAFKLSPGLIKLTQALFLLDHEDFQGFLDIMIGQLVFDSDIRDWHHKLVMRSLLRSNQNKLALIYLRIRKPPLSSIDDQSTVVTLSIERGLVQSAFHHRPPSHYTELLMRFFRACKMYGKLNDIMHLALNSDEEEAFITFLEQEKCEETRLLYYLQRCKYTEATNVFPSDQNLTSLQRANKPASLSMFHAYNATLPEITRRFTSNFIRRNMEIDSDSRYSRPMSHYKSRVKTREIYETAINKAKETYLRCDRSRIPFLSAPCASSKSVVENTDANCVLFVELARKNSSKRSLDDMLDGDQTPEKCLDVTKRRKICHLSEKPNETIAGLATISDTPLVKRKSQIINTTDVPCETPQSILKSRQLTRESSSPLGKAVSSEDEKEKKPRQIRFSINQPQIVEDAISEDIMVDNTDVIEEVDGEDNGVKVLDESDVQEIDKRSSVSPQPTDVSAQSEVYFSPNASTKSISATAVLSDASSLQSENKPWPQRRPYLRRSGNVVDSPFDDSRKSLGQDTSIESIADSVDAAVDDFLSSRANIVSSTFIDGYTPKTSITKNRAELTSISQYASSVLSSDCSMELTNSERVVKRMHPLYDSSLSDSSNSSTTDDIPCADHSKVEENKINSFNYSNVKSIFTEVDDQDNNDDEKKNMKIVDKVDKTTEIKSEVTEDMSTLEIPENSKEKCSISTSPDHSADDLKLKVDKNNEITEDEYQIKLETSAHVEEAHEIEAPSPADEDRESMETSDNGEDELMALKYEDDEEDDVFESLHNSLEVNNREETPVVTKTLDVKVSPKKSPTARFYEDFNITDDESSKSVNSEMVEKSILDKSNVPQNSSQATTIAIDDMENITDDESECSRDLSLQQESKKSTDNKNQEQETEIENSKSQEENINKTLNKNEDEKLNLISEKMTSLKRISTVDLEENTILTDEMTPVRTTRSRRASSVVPTSSESSTEALETRRLLTRSNSLSKGIFSPITKTSSASSGSESPISSPVKRGRRRSVSLIKEVLTTSIHPPESTSHDISEQPIRRSTRRAASVQKELASDVSVVVVVEKTPTQNIKSLPIVEKMTNKDDQEVSTPKRRGRPPGSTNKDVNKTDVQLRKTRAASVAKDDTEETEKNEKNSKRTRVASTSSDIALETAVENSHPPKRTRTTSVTKDPANGSVVKETKRKTRAASVAKEDQTSDQLPKEVTESRRKRATSVTKDLEPTARKTRGASVSKDSFEEVPRKTRAASVPKDDPEESHRRRCAVSVTKDINEATTSRSRRGGSVTKDNIAEDNSTSTKRVRTSSVTNDSTDDESTTSKRVTRRRGSTKDTVEETNLKTRKGNIITDIIPEEDDDEDNIYDAKNRRKGPRNNVKETEGMESQLVNKRKTRAGSISTIPEHDELVIEEQRNLTTSGRGRLRRAVSVDIPTTDVKRRTRGLAESAISEANEEEESHQMQTDTEMKSKKIPARRKRAASETKDINNSTLVSIRPRRGTKGESAKKNDNDSHQLEYDQMSTIDNNDTVDVSSSQAPAPTTRSTKARR